MSFGEACPDIPSVRSPILGLTFTALPANCFPRSTTENSPTPPCPTIWAAANIVAKSSSDKSELPPGLYAWKRTSSSLKSVGLSNTRTPFSSVHTVASISSSRSVVATAEPVGMVASRGASTAVSSYGAISIAITLENASPSTCSLGSVNPSFCGADTITTRFSSTIHSDAMRFASASSIVGSNAW